MNKTLLYFFAAALALPYSAMAQNKISPAGRIILNDYEQSVMAVNSTGGQQTPVYAAVITLKSADDVETLRDAGVDVVSEFGTVVTADISLDRMEQVAAIPGVVYLQFGEYREANMNFARLSGNVTEAQDGFSYNGTTSSYDGTGVIAGLMDTGMDANHINFKDDNNQSRVERLWWFRSTNGSSTQYTSSTISSFTTDDSSESHATHVAGIMAGSYKGSGQVAAITNSSTGAGLSVGAADMPYYGVATGAKLAISVGALSDANILNGVSKIVEYAEAEGKPCVVNMSLGSNFGPHDGTTAYNQALAELGKKAIICMSSGNEGQANLYVNKTFASASDDLKTMVNTTDITGRNSASGLVDVWGGSSKVLSVSWAVYNSSTRSLVTLATISASGQSASVTASNASFNAAFSGSISMAGEVNPLNNRWHVASRLASVARKNTATTSYLALVVKAVSGEKVYVYGASDITFASNSLVGWSAGSPDCSINDGACGDNVVSVGAYTSSVYFPTLSRAVYAFTGHGNVDAIAPFSSYGSTFQGVAKPDVAAPGSAIVSSYSRYYYSANKLSASDVSASAVRAGITNYWGPMQGTSMACPFVSGVVALWLQADPSLKYDDVMDIIRKTSSFNSLTMRPAEKWGAGKIDAVAGLKEILDRSAIGTVWADSEERLIVTPAADGYEVFVAAVPRVDITLYTIGGMIAAKSGAEGSAATVSTSGLAKGMYLLTVDSEAGRFTRRVLVK